MWNLETKTLTLGRERRWVKSNSFLLQGLLFVLDSVLLMGNSNSLLNSDSSREPTLKCVITMPSPDKSCAVNERQCEPIAVQLPGLSIRDENSIADEKHTCLS